MDLSPIPLPYGKTYHLFLSFCQEDEEIAFSLLQELENKYQLKCLYHLRDFKPGVHVTENILDGIEKSMKIVYLVSQKFKESQLCKMETLYGITASHKQCENSLIPVLLEPIEMPRELQTINYVDGTLDGTDKACKIYKACLFGDVSNGMPLRVIRRVEKTVWCIPVTRFSEDMTKRKRVKDEARSRQIDELCCEIVEKLNLSKFTTNYYKYNGGFWVRVWCFFVLGAPALSVLPLLVFLVIVGDITEETLAGVCSTLAIVPIVAVSIVVCCCFYLKRETLLSNITWKYLRENYKTLKVLPLIRSTEEVVILNYDTDPCKIEADSIILGFIYRNQTLLANWFGLEDFKYDRHNTYFQKKCICQYLEPSLLSDLFSDN
uniref:TIR domain-containing protein n=1 Tax=Magallana gigas TaxID=29159 RepID=A0A8W8LP44_MAGGI